MRYCYYDDRCYLLLLVGNSMGSFIRLRVKRTAYKDHMVLYISIITKNSFNIIYISYGTFDFMIVKNHMPISCGYLE